MGYVPSILVTGANGQLGSELKKLSSAYSQYTFTFLTRDEFPLNDTVRIKDYLKSNQFDFLINCAAYTAVDKAESEKELAWQINATAVGVLAAACRDNIIKFLHISTDYVFDGTAKEPYKADDLTNPQTVYGASKLEGERLAMNENSDAIIIRTSWVYSSYGNNFVKTMLRLFQEKEQISVVNDQIGSPTYAADLAEVIMKMISSGQWYEGIYHFSNEGVISWFDFAGAIKNLSGSSCKINPIPTSAYPTPAKRPAWSVLEKSKIQQHYGIQFRNWEESLRLCIEKIKKAQ
ncbi:MAG: dTDP-4-dehydrorhamnose reductase [Chitinophagaceae bacterium]|nr:dTDP-4-dehydrorhamnose reductase [Chitinophagaceae bacterium]